MRGFDRGTLRSAMARSNRKAWRSAEIISSGGLVVVLQLGAPLGNDPMRPQPSDRGEHRQPLRLAQLAGAECAAGPIVNTKGSPELKRRPSLHPGLIYRPALRVDTRTESGMSGAINSGSDCGCPAGRAGPTILVDEDKVLIRFMPAEHLRGCGYRVLEAADAAEAVRIWSENLTIDVLCADVQMPGRMNGLGLARWTREYRPGVPIIVASGYGRSTHEPGELH
jgi:CheY-like chemotaxis protein